MLPFNSIYLPGEDTCWNTKVSKTVPTFSERMRAVYAFTYFHSRPTISLPTKTGGNIEQKNKENIEVESQEQGKQK